jgi:hypothetical protein
MTWIFNKSPTLYERLAEQKKRLEIQNSGWPRFGSEQASGKTSLA